ncbi:hypothetical protein BK026_01715 [Alteromonas sp. V450]|uniref:hypothetical protein n=1 Tax=Alteromonas sp. V450 TaxID=1912139 RepID=UPI0008FF6C91|nr:hypothetical protein [Alteromonas sp. V450]OJF67608.1 hypothetical protein BK026_01715 [Alteromonas sp. V450]
MFARPRKQRRYDVNQRIKTIHSAIADKLMSHPELFEQVEQTLEMRYQNKMMRYGSYLLWKGIIEARHEPDVFKALLLADDERTANLRRETIFTGILSEQEREQLL